MVTTHHCPGKNHWVGEIPPSGCVPGPGPITHCKTHQNVCRYHPERPHLKSGEGCTKCHRAKDMNGKRAAGKAPPPDELQKKKREEEKRKAEQEKKAGDQKKSEDPKKPEGPKKPEDQNNAATGTQAENKTKEENKGKKGKGSGKKK